MFILNISNIEHSVKLNEVHRKFDAFEEWLTEQGRQKILKKYHKISRVSAASTNSFSSSLVTTMLMRSYTNLKGNIAMVQCLLFGRATLKCCKYVLTTNDKLSLEIGIYIRGLEIGIYIRGLEIGIYIRGLEIGVYIRGLEIGIYIRGFPIKCLLGFVHMISKITLDTLHRAASNNPSTSLYEIVEWQV